MHWWAFALAYMFLGAIFECVGREDGVSAPDFSLSSVCRVKVSYVEQAAVEDTGFVHK